MLNEITVYKDIYWNDNYKGREPINIKKHLNAFKNDLLKLSCYMVQILSMKLNITIKDISKIYEDKKNN